MKRNGIFFAVESVPYLYLGRAQSIPSISKAECSVTELRLKEDQTKRFQSDLNQVKKAYQMKAPKLQLKLYLK